MEIFKDATLDYGCDIIDQGNIRWRGLINNNMNNVYSKLEITPLIDGRAPIIHTHNELFPKEGLIGTSDISAPLNTMSSDLSLDTGYAVYLVDRATYEIYKVTIASGNTTLTAMGEYGTPTQNTVNVTQSNMIPWYPNPINGEVV